MLLSLVIAVAASIVAVFFANVNPTVIQVNVFGTPISGSLGVVIVISVGLGALLGVLMMLPTLVSRSWAIIRYKRKLQELQDAAQVQTQKAVPPE